MLSLSRYNVRMYAFLLAASCLLIVLLLAQLNAMLAVLFFFLALIAAPALILHRREIAGGVRISPDGEAPAQGAVRLARVVGVDVSGIGLGVLLFILLALGAHALSH